MCDASALLSAGSSPSLASKDQIPPPPTPSAGIVAQRHHKTLEALESNEMKWQFLGRMPHSSL